MKEKFAQGKIAVKCTNENDVIELAKICVELGLLNVSTIVEGAEAYNNNLCYRVHPDYGLLYADEAYYERIGKEIVDCEQMISS